MGSEMCIRDSSYSPPVSTLVATTTPPTSVSTSTKIDVTTVTSYTTSYSTYLTVTTMAVSAPVKRDEVLQTPASASTWSPSRLSKACSAVATGTSTTTLTQTAATPLTTLITTQSSTVTSVVSTVVVSSSTSINTIVVSSSNSINTAVAVTTLGPNLVSNPSFEQKASSNGSPGPISDWFVNNANVYLFESTAAAFDGSELV